MFARAATKTFVSSEEVVATKDLGGKEGAIFNRFERSLVSGVVHAPCGAHPTSCAPNYGFDMEHLKAYSAAAKSFGEYSDKFLTGTSDQYIEAAGGAAAINKILYLNFSMSDQTSLAEICISASSKAWKGDGEILATGIGLIPRIAAGLAKINLQY